MSERDDIIKRNSETTANAGNFPRSNAGFLVMFFARSVNAFSKFIHKWGKP